MAFKFDPQTGEMVDVSMEEFMEILGRDDNLGMQRIVVEDDGDIQVENMSENPMNFMEDLSIDNPMANAFFDNLVADFNMILMSIEERIEAAENGDTDCMQNLAFAFLDGDGVDQDFEKSAYWWEKLADTGSSLGQFNIGLCYAKGCGVERDLAKATEWMRKAAENGDEDAVDLVDLYANAAENLKKAEQGDAVAQAEMSAFYVNLSGSLEQFGRDNDYAEAFAWAKKSSEQGNTDGMYDLALCYDHGRGTSVDRTKSVEIYQKAAELGHAPSQWNLAVCYFDGIGVEADEIKGMYWAYASIDQEYELAIRGMTEEEKTIPQIIQYFDKDKDGVTLIDTQFEGRADRCEKLHEGTELTYKIVQHQKYGECIECFFNGNTVGILLQWPLDDVVALLKMNRISIKIIVKKCIPKSKRGARARIADVTVNLVVTEEKVEGLEEKARKISERNRYFEKVDDWKATVDEIKAKREKRIEEILVSEQKELEKQAESNYINNISLGAKSFAMQTYQASMALALLNRYLRQDLISAQVEEELPFPEESAVTDYLKTEIQNENAENTVEEIADENGNSLEELKKEDELKKSIIMCLAERDMILRDLVLALRTMPQYLDLTDETFILKVNKLVKLDLYQSNNVKEYMYERNKTYTLLQFGFEEKVPESPQYEYKYMKAIIEFLSTGESTLPKIREYFYRISTPETNLYPIFVLLERAGVLGIRSEDQINYFSLKMDVEYPETCSEQQDASDQIEEREACREEIGKKNQHKEQKKKEEAKAVKNEKIEKRKPIVKQTGKKKKKIVISSFVILVLAIIIILFSNHIRNQRQMEAQQRLMEAYIGGYYGTPCSVYFHKERSGDYIIKEVYDNGSSTDYYRLTYSFTDIKKKGDSITLSGIGESLAKGTERTWVLKKSDTESNEYSLEIFDENDSSVGVYKVRKQ